MAPITELQKITLDQRAIAPMLVLILGKLTGWNFPVPKGGDPVYLTAEQATALAAEGIRLLSPYLGEEAHGRVSTAVEKFSRPTSVTDEEKLVNLGGLGGIIPSTHNPGGAPGCCVMINGHLVCVR